METQSRIVSILLMLLLLPWLAGCGPSGTSGGSSTQVTISLGQSVLAGALSAPGVIPASVRSFSVRALDSAGQTLAGPVVATLPQTTVTLTVPNGSGIVFELLAYDAANALGKVVYQGRSAPQALNGQAVTVAVTLNLAVTVTASSLQTGQGGSITLNGFVAGAPPPATSPLLWSATGGTLSITAVNGASVVWTAPNTVAAVGQTYAISARIDPAVNPQQDPNVTGGVNILIVPQRNIYGFAMSGNLFSVNGVNLPVDAYGNAANAQATVGNFQISFGFRDYTGKGAWVRNPAFRFDVRELAPGLRRAIGIISPVTVTTLSNGQVQVDVPAGALLDYTATSAAGTTVIAQSSNGLANLITTSQLGVVTLDVQALLRLIAGRSSPAMDIFASAGQFRYEIGFDTIDMGHENPSATGLDRLYDVSLNTSTRGVRGIVTIQ